MSIPDIKYLMNLINIDGVDIPFEPYWNVAISLSGGADSALLAYLVCNNAVDNQTVHIISHTRMWKTRPWQSHDSLVVYEWLVKRFPKLNFVRHVGFIAPDLEWGSTGPTLTDEYGKLVSGDIMQMRSFAEYTCKKNKVHAYYNAVTRNPRNVDFQGMYTRDIERTADNEHLMLKEHMGFMSCHPFRFTSKDWVVKQYINLDIQDLFDLTRSCEGEFSTITYENYKPGQYVPLCNTCFWCKEREWAIEHAK